MEALTVSASSASPLSILRKHWLIAAASFTGIAGIFMLTAALQAPRYIAAGTLQFQQAFSAKAKLQGSKSSSGLPNVDDLATRALETEIEILRSTPITQSVIAKLRLTDSQGSALGYREFGRNLAIKLSKSSNLLDVMYEDSDPGRASAVVNLLMATYLQVKAQSQQARAITVQKNLGQQLSKVEHRLQQAEGALRQFKGLNRIIALKDEATAAVAVLSNLQQRAAELQAQALNLETQSMVLQRYLKMDSPQAMLATVLGQSADVQVALKNLQQQEAQLAIAQIQLATEHPAVVQLQRQVSTLQQILQMRVAQTLNDSKLRSTSQLLASTVQQQLISDLIRLEANRLGLISQVQGLKDAQAVYQRRVAVMPQLEQQQRRLERDLDTTQATYTFLQAQLRELQSTSNQGLSSAQILATALVPDRPVATNTWFYGITGMVAGSVCAGLAVTLRAALNHSVQTVREAQALFQVPVLGIIPALKKTSQRLPNRQTIGELIPAIALRDLPTSAASEAFRMLQSNLEFIESESRPRVIVVTSSVAEEGKSTVAANLAVAIAQSGRKVLLVDANLRGPFQHRIWRLPNTFGLSDVLSKQMDPRKAARKVMVTLDVMTTGAVASTRVALLHSQRMLALIKHFAAVYDYVIFDTPALDASADASTLGRLADGMLLVVAPGIVNTDNAAFPKEILAQGGHRVLGMVVNNITNQQDAKQHTFTTPQETRQLPPHPKPKASPPAVLLMRKLELEPLEPIASKHAPKSPRDEARERLIVNKATGATMR
jgi:capsular exopolysaccharide synthesis family protein